MKKKAIIVIVVGVALLGFALMKMRKKDQPVTTEGGATPPEAGDGAGSQSNGSLFDQIGDVMGLTDSDPVQPPTTVEPPAPTGTGGGTTTTYGGGTATTSGGSCFIDIDALEPLPDNLGCISGYENPVNCKGGGTCIPGFSTTPTNVCGAGVARWQKVLNEHFVYAGDGQCIPAQDFGRATAQTNAKTQELIDSGAISTG